MRVLSLSSAAGLLLGLLVIPVQAGVELVASKSVTVQPGGPRSGDAGSKYFNIEGKDNAKHASFGVLTFPIPEQVQGKPIKKLTLTLVQSIPRFAKDGGLKFFLAPESVGELPLKFDPDAPDGVGSQIKPLQPLGSGEFKKVETGKTETFSLSVDDAVRERIARPGKFCLVIVPDDAAVAATYFGAIEADKEKSPRLTLELP